MTFYKPAFNQYKIHLGLFFFLIRTATGVAQLPVCFEDTSSPHKWMAGVTAGWSSGVNGYTKVREFQYDGDKLSLPDGIGFNHFFQIGFEAGKKLNPSSAVILSAHDYIFSSHTVITKDVWFNGTHLEGADGISINTRSKWYHIRLAWQKQFTLSPSWQLAVAPGLLYDGINLFLNAAILPDTYRSEPSEDFITQALPYPNLELHLIHRFSASPLLVAAKVNGSYMPLFKSFFREGGQISLNYSSWNASLSAIYPIGHWQIEPQLGVHYLRTFEESNEDTNDWKADYLSADVSLQYVF